MRSEAIAAFSGRMIAVTLKGPKTIYRVLRPKGLDGGKNYKDSPWWIERMPAGAKEWREDFAVLDEFNRNNFYLKYDIPHGSELKAWKGKAAEQFDADVGQYLPGGGEQLFVEFPPAVKPRLSALPARPTNWGETEGRYGYNVVVDIAANARTEKLARYEIESKRPPRPLTNSPAVAGTRAYAAHERAEDAKAQ